MAASKRQMNWTAVGFTPSGGTLTTVTGVSDVKIDPGGKLAEFSGDADLYPTTVVNSMNNPSIVITSADVATMAGFAVGVVGTVTATLKDAKLATGGDIIYTCINAVVENHPSSSPHSQFGGGTLSFKQFSTDGTTNPTSFTRA